MFTIHRTLSEPLIATVVEWLNEQAEPHLTEDVSNYAKGRRRLWIPFEAPLSTSRPWVNGLRDDRLWDWICRTCGSATDGTFVPDTALIALGGDSPSISRHRDAPYAQFMGMGINLGRATFHYENLYPDFKWSPGVPEKGEEETFDLVGGEVYTFNVKNPHWVTNVEPGRWCINAWKISDKEIRRFNDFKGAHFDGS